MSISYKLKSSLLTSALLLTVGCSDHIEDYYIPLTDVSNDIQGDISQKDITDTQHSSKDTYEAFQDTYKPKQDIQRDTYKPDVENCFPKYYPDNDKDGYGWFNPKKPYDYKCKTEGIYTAIKIGDCEDDTPLINPTAPEICDGIDNNCNGLIDDSEMKGAPCFEFNCNGEWQCQGMAMICVTPPNCGPK